MTDIQEPDDVVPYEDYIEVKLDTDDTNITTNGTTSSSSSSSSTPRNSSSSSSDNTTSLAALAEKEPNLRASILNQLLQNLSFARSDLDGEGFSVVWYDDDGVKNYDKCKEHIENKDDNDDDDDDNNTIESPRNGGGERRSDDEIDDQAEHRQEKNGPSSSKTSSPRVLHYKILPVKKSRSPSFSRRTPSPHFLNRKQMSADGVLTLPGSTAASSRHVRFHTPSNVVVLVPTRDEIDPSTKQALWTDAKELEDQVYRNKMEYLAEGMDPCQVLEDDDFYRDVLTGELIHPYWIEQATAPEDITPVAVDDVDHWW